MFFPEVIAQQTGIIHPYVMTACEIMLTTAFGVALLRIWRGPNTVDRVVALDLIGGVILALTLIKAISEDNESFMNIGLAVAVVAFLGTVAIARYLEKMIHLGPPQAPKKADNTRK